MCKLGRVWSRIIGAWQARDWVGIPRVKCRIVNVFALIEFTLSAKLAGRTWFDVVTHSNLITVETRSTVLAVNMCYAAVWIIKDVLVSQIDYAVWVR
jgi:hypothetical protein